MMRLCLRSAAATAVLLLFPGLAPAGYLQRFERHAIPRLPDPPIRTAALANGIRYFFLEDHSLPLVRIKVIGRAGSVYDPARQAGLADLSTMLMRSGGAGERSPEEFDATVDRLGASLTAGAGAEMGEFELEILSEDLEEGAALLFDMLFAPRFDPERLKVARTKIAERLRREDDDPHGLVARRFRELVYGAGNPWARRPSRATLARILRKDVVAFHERSLRAGNLLIAAAGDVREARLVKLLERLTARASPGTAELPAVEPVPLAFSPEEERVARPVTQAFIRMGHLGIRRHNPDKYALLLLGEILGGVPFKSRLMEDIRTKRGMAYSIWSDMTPGTDYGLFVVGVDTKATQTEAVIGLIREHVRRLAEAADVTPEELAFAQRSVLASLIFEFDNPFEIADRRAGFEFYGYPDHYWRIFRDRVAAVTREELQDVARRYLHPEALKVVVVGPRRP